MQNFRQHLFLPVFTILTAFVLCFKINSPATAMPYISVDLDGHVLAHNQAFDRWYPASLTKLMTTYIAFRALQEGKLKLQTPIKLSAAAAKVVPSRSGWRAGSTLTLNTALTVMMVRSANDMANAIAEAVAGSQNAFTAEMNRQAVRLGMTGTHFSNPSGLPDIKNYSNARDIALLAIHLRRDFPQYAHYFDIPAIDFGKGRKIQMNSNNLIGRYNGADGMKTGFICASGFNLAASATRNGRTIIVVVLGAARVDIREETAAKLLSQGFKAPGSTGLTLATLKPYGLKQTEITNMREQICNLEASKSRMGYRDDKGKVIFNSPFMDVLNEKPVAVPVKVIYEPPPPKIKKAKAPAGKRASSKKLPVKKAGKVSKPHDRLIMPPPDTWNIPAPQSQPIE